jgi:ribonuclease P protein component
MIKKTVTLAKKRDFDLLIKWGFWIKGSNFSIKALKLAEIPDHLLIKEDVNNFRKQLKIAVSVGLKLSKSAVVRNRTKRRVWEVIRIIMKEKPVNAGYYILVVPNKIIDGLNLPEISEEIKSLLIKKGILNA